MRLKTLLVCLTSPSHAETLMRQAVPLARKHNAHVIGLHTVEALLVYPGIAIHVPESTFASFTVSQQKEADAIKEVFDRHTRNEDFPSEFRLVRAESVSASDRMVESARAADLVLMVQEDGEKERFDQQDVQAKVIRNSGRPVIVIPVDYDGPEIGQNILVGWSTTREATRAAHDVLTVAQDGANVTVLQVARAAKELLHDSDALDLAEMYARHGLKATLENRDPIADSIADILHRVAFEKGADLIATGAFGHSRIYDFVIGATTYTLLREAKFPILYSK